MSVNSSFSKIYKEAYNKGHELSKIYNTSLYDCILQVVELHATYAHIKQASVHLFTSCLYGFYNVPIYENKECYNIIVRLNMVLADILSLHDIESIESKISELCASIDDIKILQVVNIACYYFYCQVTKQHETPPTQSLKLKDAIIVSCLQYVNDIVLNKIDILKLRMAQCCF